MLLATQCYNVIDPTTGAYLVQSQVADLGQPSVEYTIAALGTLLGRNAGGIIISITLFFFAFTTVMAYYYYAETNLVYLFGKARERRIRLQGKYFDISNPTEARQRDRLIFDSQRDERRIITILRILFIGSVFFGSLKEAGVIWSLGDMGVGLMAWINIIAILLLSPKAFRILRDYERQQKAGIKNPKFTPRDLDIQDADFWAQQ